MTQPIRQATCEDAQAVANIANAMIRDTLVTFSSEEKTAADFEAMIRRLGHRFLVAEGADGVVGYATYDSFRNGTGYRYTQEHSIHLSQSAQRQGLGRALMARLEQIARDDGVEVLVAGISGANPRAVGFHRALGYDEVGHMPGTGRKWGRRLDLVLMQKQLLPIASQAIAE